MSEQKFQRILPYFEQEKVKLHTFNTHHKWKSYSCIGQSTSASTLGPNRSISVQSTNDRIKKIYFESLRASSQKQIVQLQNSGLKMLTQIKLKQKKQEPNTNLNFCRCVSQCFGTVPGRKPLQYFPRPELTYAGNLFWDRQVEHKQEQKQSMEQILSEHLIKNYYAGPIENYDHQNIKVKEKKQKYVPLNIGASDFQLIDLKKIKTVTDHKDRLIVIKRGYIRNDADVVIIPIEKQTTIRRRIHTKKKNYGAHNENFDDFIKMQEAKIKAKLEREEIMRESQRCYEIFQQTRQWLTQQSYQIRKPKLEQQPKLSFDAKPLISQQGMLIVLGGLSDQMRQKLNFEIKEGKVVKHLRLVDVKNQDLPSFHSLEHIEITQSQIGDIDITAVKVLSIRDSQYSRLYSTRNTLLSLTLSNVNLVSLSSVDLKSAHLKHLNISFNPLTNPIMIELFNTLPSTFIQNLNISFIPLQRESLQILAQATIQCIFLTHLEIQQCYSSNQVIQQLKFEVEVVHFSDCVIAFDQRFQRCPRCDRFRKITLRSNKKQVRLKCLQTNTIETIQLEMDQVQNHTKLRCNQRNLSKVQEIDVVHRDSYGQGLFQTEVWLEPDLKYEFDNVSFIVQKREQNDSQDFIVNVTEQDIKDRQVATPNYVLYLQSILKKSEKRKYFKMFTTPSETPQELMERAYEQDLKQSSVAQYIADVYGSKPNRKQKNDIEKLNQLIVQNYFTIINVFQILQNYSFQNYPMVTKAAVEFWLQSKQFKVRIAPSESEFVTRGFLLHSLLLSVIETYNPKLNDQEESTEIDLISDLYSEIITQIEVIDYTQNDYKTDVVLKYHKDTINQILQQLKIVKHTQVPMQNIVDYFQTRYPEASVFKHCIVSRKSIEIEPLNQICHSLNEFYNFLVFLSKEVIVDNLPDFVKLDLILTQLKSLI